MIPTTGDNKQVDYFKVSQTKGDDRDDRYDFPEYKGLQKHAYLKKIGHVVLDEIFE